MAPLFGPLAAASSLLGGPASYGGAYPYAAAPTTELPGWQQAATGQRARRPINVGNGLIYPPVYPAPALGRGNSPLAPYGPPPPAGLIGLQTTRADRLFGPFARISAGLGAGRPP